MDNDVGAGIPDALGIWRSAHESRALVDFDARQNPDRSITITTKATYLGGRLVYDTRYDIRGNGQLSVTASVGPADGADLPEFYRIGMTTNVPSTLVRLDWFGRGPHESYADRSASAAIGRYGGTVLEQFHDYSRPQETGNKQDVRWLSLRDHSGAGIEVAGDPVVHVNALPFRYEELGFFPGQQRHGADLKPGDEFTLNIDAYQMGVGGDNSWGFWPLPDYRLPMRAYDYRFHLTGLSVDDRPGALSRRARR